MSKRSSRELLRESDDLLVKLDRTLSQAEMAEKVDRLLQSAAPGRAGALGPGNVFCADILNMPSAQYLQMVDVWFDHESCWYAVEDGPWSGSILSRPHCTDAIDVEHLPLESRTYYNAMSPGSYTPWRETRNNYEAYEFSLRDQERLSVDDG